MQNTTAWSYLSSADLVDLVPATWDPTQMLWIGAGDSAISRDAARAGTSVHVVRRWSAPCDATVTLSGSARVQAPGPPEGSDGEVVIIRHRDASVWASPIGGPDGYEASYSSVPAFAVSPGDTVDFVVTSGGGEDDAVREWIVFDPTIAFTPL
jgi:hypothetical protein